MFDKIPFPFFMKRTVHGLFKLPISLRHGDTIAAGGITPRSRRKCADLTNVLVIHLRTLLLLRNFDYTPQSQAILLLYLQLHKTPLIFESTI